MRVMTLALALLLAGCASAGKLPTLDGALDQLAELKRADLEQAKVIAAAASDPAGWACADALLKVTDRPPLPPPAGAFSAYMWARAKHRALAKGTDETVHNACAPLVVDAGRVLIGIGKNFVPGGGFLDKIPFPGLR